MSLKIDCKKVRMLVPCLFFILFGLAANAQQTVTGKVTNKKDNSPVGYATVTVKGTTVATTSDADGDFTITLPAGKSVLTISSVGFATTDVDASSGTVSVQLAESTSSLDEIVVTGYTAQKKKDITGAVSVVDVEQMNKLPTGQINNQLQGQAPGVTVIGSGQPGETPQVRIRGINTFGDNSPLYVVDGVPTGNINDLNPNDVASLQVLKDAGAASIYGSRANNGVIIITTKKGKGKATVSYDGYYGTQVVKGGNPWNLLNPQENADLTYMAYRNDGLEPTTYYSLYGSGDKPVLPDYIAPAGAKEGDPSVNPDLYYVNPNYTDVTDLGNFYRISKANKAGTDWYHAICKDAPMQSHNLSVSGGSDKNSYLFSFNYLDQQGTILQTYQKKYNIRVNTQFSIGNHVRIGENLSYSINDNPQITPLSEGSFIGYALREEPIIPVYDIMGNFAGNYGAALGNAFNPVATAYRTRNNKGLGQRLFGAGYIDIDIMSGLTFHSQFGGEVYSGYYHSFGYPTYENTENSTSNTYYEGSDFGYNWTWTNTLTYHRIFGKHDVQLMVGTESYYETGENIDAWNRDYFSFDPNYTTLTTGTYASPSVSSSRYYGALWSPIIARLDYQFNDKYIISGVFRHDGSSKFAPGHKYGDFPAVTVGWRVSQEKFMQSVSWVNDLKLRAGWGIMGNQKPANQENQYATYNSDKGSSFYDIGGTNNSLVQGFRTGQVPNEAGKWEKDINSNIGIDATLFKNKLNFTLDYYQKDIKDLLFNPPLPGAAGNGTAPYVNIAQMHTNGWDGAISYHGNITHDLQFDVGFNLTSYKNKVMQVSSTSDYFFTSDARRFNNNFIINQVGQPVNEFYGYKVIGYFNTQAEIDALDAAASKATNGAVTTYETDAGLGRFKYADVNGDGYISDEDRTYIGNPNPKFTYGINIGLTYKAFDFSAFFFGSQGNKIWNNVKYWTDLFPTFVGAKSKTALYDSWTPDNTDAAAPMVSSTSYFSTSGVASSWYVQNGSYLRCKYMVLGYTLNASNLGKTGIQSVRIYVQAANLFTITKYPGVDPEINSSAGSDTESRDFGVDEGSYATPKQFIIGLNVKF
jgi:TonB-linked SusC/RagA family outer membrane protein